MSDDAPVIRASYSETEDYLLEAWIRYPLGINRNPWVFCTIGLVIVVLVCGWLGLRDFRKGEPLWWIVLPIGLVVAVGLIHYSRPASQRREMLKTVRKQVTDPPTRCTLEFQADGFSSTGRGGATMFHPWGTLHRVEQCTDGLLVFLSAGSYFWLPEKAFVSRQDYVAVCDLIAAKVGNFKRSGG